MNWQLFIRHIVSLTFLLVFLLLFLPLRWKKGRSILLTAVCFTVTTAVDALQCMAGSGMAALAVTMLEIVLVQGEALLLCRYRDFRALFVGISASAYVLVGNVASILFLLRSGKFLLSILLQILVHGLFLFFLALFGRRDLALELRERQDGWGPLCLIPALFYAIIYTLTVWPSNIAERPSDSLGILLVLLLMGASYTLIFHVVAQSRRSQELLYSNKCLETCANSLKKEFRSMRQNQLELSILKHDIRHRDNLIRIYLDQGDTESIRGLLECGDHTLEKTITAKYCDNVAVNGILVNLAGMAAERRVSFSCEASVPERLSVNEFELATVISNLAENAVQAAGEAPEGARFVRIRIRPVKEQMILSVSNAYRGKLTFSQETGLPISQKGASHGYGLKSVQAFVRKQNAVFDCSASNGVFSARLLLSLPPLPEAESGAE